MILDFLVLGKMKVDMRYYIDGMLKEFPQKMKPTTKSSRTERLFKVNKDSKRLEDKKRALFHKIVMKGMFLCKRARSDISPGIGLLASRVKEPTEQDWNKLVRLLAFLKGTRNDVLTLEADDSQELAWYIDAFFAVHPNMKSHTEAVFFHGKRDYHTRLYNTEGQC